MSLRQPSRPSCDRYLRGCSLLALLGIQVRRNLQYCAGYWSYIFSLSAGNILHQLVSSAVTLYNYMRSRTLIISLPPTTHFSRVPNFILAFIPAEINPNTLNTMTAFAVCPYVYLLRSLSEADERADRWTLV